MSAHLPVKAKARSITCVQRRSAHRIRGTTLVVGTGGAVRPFTLCLSAQCPRCTDPTIAPAFDGLKISVSRRVAFIDRSLLRSSFLGPRNEGFNRCLSPPGFRSAPQSGGYGALEAPSTEMSCITIYRADRLEHRTRASSMAVSANAIERDEIRDVDRRAVGRARPTERVGDRGNAGFGRSGALLSRG